MRRVFAAVRIQRPRLSEVAIGLALVALVNVPFWLLQTRYFMARPVFNADLALALSTMAWGRVALVCAVAIAWALDAVQGLSLVYHFPSVADFAATAKFAPTIHFAEFVNAEVIAIVTLFAVGIAIVLWLTKHRGASPRGVILASVVLMLIDVANGSGLPTLFGSDSVVINANVQGSPLLNLASSARHAQKQAAEPLQTVDQPGIASTLQWAKDNDDGALLIVIVESWGEHVDPALRAWSDRRLNAPEVTARWHVTRATSRFKGATTAGELRELCGLSGHYSRLTPEQASACLPNLLKPTGFDAIALHGFSGAMFERTHWWSTLDSLEGSLLRTFRDLRRVAAAPSRASAIGTCSTWQWPSCGRADWYTC